MKVLNWNESAFSLVICWRSRRKCGLAEQYKIKSRNSKACLLT